MLYPIAIEKGTETTAYGVIFPDVKGCFSAGDNYTEALENAHEVLDAHLMLLAEDGILPPKASTIEDHIDNPEYEGFLWALVDVDISPYMGGAVKKNVTLPKLLLKQIDDIVAANSSYKDRSHFLQIASINELQRQNF